MQNSNLLRHSGAMRKHRTWYLEIPGSRYRAPRNDGPNLKRAHREIAQPQVRVAAFFPDSEQCPVQGLAEQVVALAHGNADALTEIAAFDKGAAGKDAAIAGVGAVDPERKRNRVAENEGDLPGEEARAARISPRPWAPRAPKRPGTQ